MDGPGGPSVATILGPEGPSMATKIAIDGPGGLILGWHDSTKRQTAKLEHLCVCIY